MFPHNAPAVHCRSRTNPNTHLPHTELVLVGSCMHTYDMHAMLTYTPEVRAQPPFYPNPRQQKVLKKSCPPK